MAARRLRPARHATATARGPDAAVSGGRRSEPDRGTTRVLRRRAIRIASLRPVRSDPGGAADLDRDTLGQVAAHPVYDHRELPVGFRTYGPHRIPDCARRGRRPVATAAHATSCTGDQLAPRTRRGHPRSHLACTLARVARPPPRMGEPVPRSRFDARVLRWCEACVAAVGLERLVQLTFPRTDAFMIMATIAADAPCAGAVTRWVRPAADACTHRVLTEALPKFLNLKPNQLVRCK